MTGGFRLRRRLMPNRVSRGCDVGVTVSLMLSG